MREWGPSKPLVVEGYRIAIEAKPLHVIDETFCSVPIDGANYCHLVRLIFTTSIERLKSAKRGSNGGVPSTFMMIKSAKGWRRRRIHQLKFHIFPLLGVYSNFPLILGKIIL